MGKLLSIDTHARIVDIHNSKHLQVFIQSFTNNNDDLVEIYNQL